MLLVLDLEGSRHDIVSHTYFDLLEHHIFGHAFGMQLGELREENSGLLAQKSKLEVLLYATTISIIRYSYLIFVLPILGALLCFTGVEFNHTHLIIICSSAA
jgi:hypothetical protein